MSSTAFLLICRCKVLLFPDAATGRRTVDKLVKVWLKDGTEIWTVVHVEIQGKADPGFARRMYMYNYRLFDKHDRKIISLAVLLTWLFC